MYIEHRKNDFFPESKTDVLVAKQKSKGIDHHKFFFVLFCFYFNFYPSQHQNCTGGFLFDHFEFLCCIKGDVVWISMTLGGYVHLFLISGFRFVPGCGLIFTAFHIDSF